MLRQVRCPNAPVLLPCSETHCYVVQKENLNMSSRWFILDDLDEMRRRAIRFPGGFKNGIAYLFRTYLTTFPCAVADRIATLGRRECRRKGEVE
jgi:hypothetical protein